MFDNIKCEYPLPGAPIKVQDDIFQTKDFDNAMDDYTITKEGRLILHKKVYEEVPEEERPYYGKPEWEKPLFKVFGCVKSRPVADIDIQHHGYIRIYTILNRSDDDARGEWYEYALKFTDGKLESVERVNDNG
jgi:hypothetical protein